MTVHTPAGAQCHLFVFNFPATLLHPRDVEEVKEEEEKENT